MRLGGACNAAREVFLPALCLHCGEPLPGDARAICARCLEAFGRDDITRCGKCGMEVDEPNEECLRCRAAQPPQAGTIVGGDHQGVRRSLVVALKHGGRDDLAIVLGAPLADRIMDRGAPARADLVTAVPSHPLHRLRRGWSAAALLATVIAGRLGLPRAELLCRRGLTRQVGRTRRQRLALASHRFTARRPIHHAEVLLVDDVTTTGATLRRASEALLDAGAARVWCAVAAAAPDARRPT